MTIKELADEAKRQISLNNKKAANVYLSEIYYDYLSKINPYSAISTAEKIKMKNPEFIKRVEIFNKNVNNEIEFIKSLEA